MLKFERLSIVMADKIRKQFTIGLILVGVLIFTVIASLIISSYSGNLDTMSNKLAETQVELEEYNEKNNVLKSEAKNASVKQSKLTTKEQLVVCLGECAGLSDCSITGLSSNTVSEGQAITRYNFTFEVKGSLASIARTLGYLDEKGICYSVNLLSLRQEADYIWLQRNITDNITWWDLSNYISGGEQTKTSISSEEILADTAMKFYVDMDFIVVNELM